MATRIQKEHWEIFQPNPTESKYKSTKPDCVVRAICAALNIDWMSAYDMMCEEGRKTYDMPDSIDVAARIVIANGFTKHSVIRKKGSTAPTPNKLAEMYPGNIILCSLAGHVVTVKEGKYWDTWQSGNKTVYTYWMK